MRPYSDDGVAVDARFIVEADGNQFAVTLESRGGASKGSAARNPEYNVALDLLLARLAGLRAELVDALVDSASARRLSDFDRRIIDGPLSLDRLTDLNQVRVLLGKSAAAVDRAPNASGEGNRTKRIRLVVAVPGFGPNDQAVLASVLSRPSTALEVSPTAVGGLLRELIGIEIPTPSGSRANTILAVDSDQVIVATSRTPSGQTVPISDVVAAMDLLRREGVIDVTVDVLGYRSAFIGALLLQLPGARAEGTSPTRIVITDSLDAGPIDLGPSSSRDVELGPFQGTLDRPVAARQRREQQRLRSTLLRGRDEAPCALCGETYPARFLWASHIKKRSAATDNEARDLQRIAMLACIFGCDALFEDGYLSVENGTVVGTGTVDLNSAIGRRIHMVRGREVEGYSESASYFQWHRQHVFLG
ncbi:hypothetical protein ACWEOH_05625 [Agromyces sp. NPDC004153]